MNERIVDYINYHPIRTQRGLEILTGLVPWIIILFIIIGSFVFPDIVAYLIIAFNVYWLYRSITMAAYALSGYFNIRVTEKINWLEKLQHDSKTKNHWKKVFHAIILTNSGEGLETLRRTLDALVNQNFLSKNLIAVLAMEDRAPEAKEKADKLFLEYKGKFGLLVKTFHKLLPDETIGKHSNEAFAAREIKKILVDEKKMDIKNITITSSDADSVLPEQYFSLLTYKFLTKENALFKFYQAPQFPFNNLDKVPTPVRIMEIISGISQIAGLRKYSRRYFVVSTYTTSLFLLDKIGYWDIDAIPEDWHINLKAYFETSGKVEVEPLFLPISIDAPESITIWKTYVNKYQQAKRQAWGVTDVPYVIKQFFLHPEIPLWQKLTKISFVLESHFVWSVNWFLITLGANIPTFFNPAFARTTLGFNLSRTSGLILTICLIGLVTIIFINIMLNPKSQRKITQFLHPMTYLQWLLLPVAGFFLSALPGLESQTRLMLGKRLEYRVTEKV